MKKIPYLFNQYNESIPKGRYKYIMGLSFEQAVNDVSVTPDEFEFCIQNPKENQLKEVLVDRKEPEEICYGRDDLLAVAEKMADEMGNINIAESLIEVMAKAAYEHLKKIEGGMPYSCTNY